ncbi:MAG: hypothetical protein IJQ70_02315 [Synergistaceae bacterium]|nr:hypothetical protein [Synergistaceae bacterium]MBR0247784.1 hypothetical protein [Synergistaceae bacterium]
MAFYNQDGSYAYDFRDPDYNGCPCEYHFTPDEFKCPREFWSQESIFLDKLYKVIFHMERSEMDFNRNHTNNRPAQMAIMHTSRHSDWHSPEFGSLSTFRLAVSVRLHNSLYDDAEAAGLITTQDIVDYYKNKKLE